MYVIANTVLVLSWLGVTYITHAPITFRHANTNCQCQQAKARVEFKIQAQSSGVSRGQQSTVNALQH